MNQPRKNDQNKTNNQNRNQNKTNNQNRGRQGGFGQNTGNKGGFGQGTGNKGHNQGGFGQGTGNRNHNQGGFGQGSGNRNRNHNQGGYGQGTGQGGFGQGTTHRNRNHNQGGFGQGVFGQIFGQGTHRSRTGQPRVWNQNSSGWSSQRYQYDRSHYSPNVQHFGQGGFGAEWRYGFRGHSGFNQRGFRFGHYRYSPYYHQGVVPSPWYFYHHLPPYLGLTGILLFSDIAYDWDAGTIYGYMPGMESRWAENQALDTSIENLRSAFLNDNQDAIAELVPPDGDVAIYNGTSYMYSVNGGDFEQLMEDNVANTDTTGFRIMQVRVYGDIATVSCQHDFTDADGNSQAVYQQYRMQRYGDRYVIVGMRTSPNAFGMLN